MTEVSPGRGHSVLVVRIGSARAVGSASQSGNGCRQHSIRYASAETGEHGLTLVELDDGRALDCENNAPAVRSEDGSGGGVAAYSQIPSPAVGAPRQDTIRGDYALFVWQDCDPVWERELDDWYSGEHIPLLMNVPGWLRVRRFERSAGRWPRFLTIHELQSLAVFADDQYVEAVSTPQRNRVACHRQNRIRRVLRRLPDTAATSGGQTDERQ